MLKKTYLAQETGGITNPALKKLVGSGEGIDIINRILGNAISLILVIGVVAAFIFMTVGAIQWMTAGSDKAKMESARGKVVSAITGLVVLFAVFAIMKLIGALFGIEQLENLFFDISPFLIPE